MRRNVYLSKQIVQSRNESRNPLRRTRQCENSSSSRPITPYEYEPVRKKRKGEYSESQELRKFKIFTSGSALKIIYKNQDFENDLQESLPNVISPLLIPSCSINTFLSDKEQETKQRSHNNKCIYPSHFLNTDVPESNTRHVTVVGRDGSIKQIVLQKVVLMHVRELSEISITNGKENNQRISQDVLRSRFSDECLNEDKNCPVTNLTHPGSTDDLLRVKSSKNFTDLRLKDSSSINTLHCSQGSSKCRLNQRLLISQKKSPQVQSMSDSEDITPYNERCSPQFVTEENVREGDNMNMRNSCQCKLIAAQCSRIVCQSRECSLNSFQKPSTSSTLY